MSFHATSKDGEEAIVREWCGELDTSSDKSAFEGNINSKRFSNPVAYHIDQTAHDVVEYLFSDETDPAVPESVEDLCRLMALQGSTPSSAFASFFKLRTIVFSKLGKNALDRDAMMLMDERIDTCVLRAMDYYSQCREQIMQFRIDELKRRDKMLERYRDGSRLDAREG